MSQSRSYSKNTSTSSKEKSKRRSSNASTYSSSKKSKLDDSTLISVRSHGKSNLKLKNISEDLDDEEQIKNMLYEAHGIPNSVSLKDAEYISKNRIFRGFVYVFRQQFKYLGNKYNVYLEIYMTPSEDIDRTVNGFISIFDDKTGLFLHEPLTVILDYYKDLVLKTMKHSKDYNEEDFIKYLELWTSMGKRSKGKGRDDSPVEELIIMIKL